MSSTVDGEECVCHGLWAEECVPNKRIIIFFSAGKFDIFFPSSVVYSFPFQPPFCPKHVFNLKNVKQINYKSCVTLTKLRQ